MENSRSPPPGDVIALEERPPSEAVILAVAEAADTDPTDLPSLYSVVDPDALDALFRQSLPGSITFEYSGYTVTVREDSGVVVQENAPVEFR